MKPRPQIVMKKGFMRAIRSISLKPRGLERPTGHVGFYKQEILSGVFPNAVSVPRRRSESPEVRDYEEQDPEHKEHFFRLDYRFEIGLELTWPWQKCEEQKEHAE